MSNNLLSLKSKIGKDIAITFAAQMLIMLTFLIVNKIVSNGLGIENYGLYSLIKKNSAVISMVMLGGMGIALPRYFALYKGRNDIQKSNYIAIASILFVIVVSVICTLSGIILSNFFENIIIGTHNLKLYLITFLYSFSIALSSYIYAFYRGSGNFIKYNLTQIIVQILLLGSTFFFKEKIVDLFLIWSILTLVYSLYELYRILRNTLIETDKNNFFKKLKSAINEISTYGITRLFGDLVLFSFYAIPLIYSNTKFGNLETAYFSVGITLSNMITPLFGLLGMVLLPYVSEQIANNQHSLIKATVNKLVLLYLIISSLISILLIQFLPFFIELLFSSEYLISINIVKIIVWSVIAQSIYLLLRNPLDAVSKAPLNTFNLIISFICMVLLLNKSSNLIQMGYAFLFSNLLLALLSIFSWYFIYPRFLIHKI